MPIVVADLDGQLFTVSKYKTAPHSEGHARPLISFTDFPAAESLQRSYRRNAFVDAFEEQPRSTAGSSLTLRGLT